MWNFKKCPRCGGDTYMDEDVGRQLYEKCLQCGFERELVVATLKRRRSPVKHKIGAA